LRFAFTAQHPDHEIERLADIVRARVMTAPAELQADPAR
jgi:hypothetical protein